MENAKSAVNTPKTVIFRHPAATFKLDENIRRNAIYINEQKPEDKELPDIYYSEALRRATDSNKMYIVIDYNQTIAFYINLALTHYYNYNYLDWSFITFFHDDEASGLKQKRQNIHDRIKRNVLMNMLQFCYIMKFTITPGYTVTEHDIKAINDFWMEPEDIGFFEDCFTSSRELPFSFYDCFMALKGIAGKSEESGETIAEGESYQKKAGTHKGIAPIQKTRRLRTQQWKKPRLGNQQRRSRR